MSFTTAGAFQTVVDSGREKRTNGVLKHLGLADVSSLRVVDNLLDANTLKVGKGVEVLFVKSVATGYIQAFDRDIQNYLDLAIYGKNIIFAPQLGGQVILPASTTTDYWAVQPPDGATHPLSVSGWTAYDVPGLPTVNFTLKQPARVRVDWWCHYFDDYGGYAATYFKAALDGSMDLDVPSFSPGAGQNATSVGVSMFTGVAAGAHSVKLRFTPTYSGTFTLNSWYSRLMVTANYS